MKVNGFDTYSDYGFLRLFTVSVIVPAACAEEKVIVADVPEAAQVPAEEVHVAPELNAIYVGNCITRVPEAGIGLVVVKENT